MTSRRAELWRPHRPLRWRGGEHRPASTVMWPEGPDAAMRPHVAASVGPECRRCSRYSAPQRMRTRWTRSGRTGRGRAAMKATNTAVITSRS